MESPLINIFSSSGSNQIQPGALPTQGKRPDSDSFFALLKGTLDMSQVEGMDQTEGGGQPTDRLGVTGRQESSAKELSRSLDIIDALAFLPILLTAQPSIDRPIPASGQTQLCSNETVKSFLSSIATALKTGNIGEVEKALETNSTLQELLSIKDGVKGQESPFQTIPHDNVTVRNTMLLTTVLPNLLAVKSRNGSSTEPSAQTGSPADAGVEDALPSLLSALKDGNGEEVEKILETGGQTSVSVEAGKIIEEDVTLPMPPFTEMKEANQFHRAETSFDAATRDAIASLVATLKAGNCDEMERILESAGQGIASSKSVKSTDSDNGTARDLIYLAATLSGLVTAETPADTNMDASIPVGNSSDMTAQDLLAPFLSAYRAGKGNEMTKGLSANGEKDTGKASGADEAYRTAVRSGLSEDYVLLNTGKDGQDKVKGLTDNLPLEVLKASPKVDVARTDASVTTSTPIHESAGDGPTADKVSAAMASALTEGVRNGKAKQAAGQALGPQNGVTASKIIGSDPSSEVSTLIDKAVISTAKGEQGEGSPDKDRQEKHVSAASKPGVPLERDDVDPLFREDLAKPGTPQVREGAGSEQKSSLASTMTRRIEEMVENFSNKSQSMDMVLRLKINDKESLLVGLKEQGNKVIVEVKSASEGLMNVLQTQKDAITKELETKNIYTTINVDPNGEGDFQRRDRKEQKQRQRAQTKEEKEFGGILNALA